MRFADLHMHTSFSDGTFSPEELAARAREQGLHTVALTDHDTVEGCERMARACGELGMEFINASEITTELDGHEIHLLGYFLDIQCSRLLENLRRFQAVRQNRIREMAAALQREGIPLEADMVFELAGCKAPGRPHVARALVQAGHVKSMDVAFDRYLKKGRSAWVPKFRIGAPEAIELVHHAGGLAVMAHPGLNKTDSVIPKMIDAGLDGIECIHSRHSYSDVERYEALAEKHDLVVTGGSDCHGLNRGKPLIGSIKLPYGYVDRMKERLAERGERVAA
jgi:predicted metal-dependent phosphoesterase TrpH